MDPRQRAKANRGKLVLLVALLLTAISLLVRMPSMMTLDTQSGTVRAFSL